MPTSVTAPSHATKSTSLQRLLAPKAIAVIGASPQPDKIGHVLMQNLAEFSGQVAPVHPKATEVLGKPAYRSVADIPYGVDLALLAVPSEATMQVLKDCVKAGVGAAVVYSIDWAETGEAGKKRQDELKSFAAEGGLRLLGPNTSGFVVPGSGLFATFVADITQSVRPGALSIVAQSGGANLSLCFQAQNEGLGVRIGVGLGNSADVGFADALNYLADDDETAVVIVAIEGVADGRGLVSAVERVAQRKPVVAVALGQSDVTEFARSHTGALTGSYRLKRAALTQAGAVVVNNLTELTDAAAALGAVRLAPKESAGVGLVTGQAGPGLLLTDALQMRGVTLPPLPDASRERLAKLLPPLTYQRNPVDTGRPSPTFGDVLRVVKDSPGIDLLTVSLLHEPNAVDAKAVLRGCSPAVLHSQGPIRAMIELRRQLREEGVAVFPTPDRTATAVSALVQDARLRYRKAAAGAVTQPDSVPAFRPRASWDEASAKDLLKELGFRTPERMICNSRDEARAALTRMRPPLAVKLLLAGVAHKTELGGVHLNVRTPEELESALDAIDRTKGALYLLEQMAPSGPELLVAARRDAAFGPIVLVGKGGTDAEVDDDVAIRLAPVSAVEASYMLSELASAKRYRGFRGAAVVDEAELGRLVARLGQLLVAYDDIELVEINPLRVTTSGLFALDAVITGS